MRVYRTCTKCLSKGAFSTWSFSAHNVNYINENQINYNTNDLL